MQFSPRVLVPPSATVAMNGLVQKKKAAGERVYNLSVGEPILPTPQVIIDAAAQAMREGKTLYPPIAGIPELRRATSLWMNRMYGSDFSADEVIVTCGGKFGLYALLHALLCDGDEALVVAPYWVSYPSMVAMFGGVSKIIDTPPRDWKATPELIQGQCTKRTKLLIINNGANPTGVLYTREEIGDILRVAMSHDLIVISDEVYSGLTYDGAEYVSCASFPEYQSRVISMQSCSKNFAMTGWRVGFVFGSKEVIDVLTTVQGQSTTGTSSISQWAALAAIEHADEIIPMIRQAVQKRRNVFVSSFNEFFHAEIKAPASALYCLLPLSALGAIETDDKAFCLRLLAEANVALVPGSAFGAPGYVRASFGGKEEDIREALEVLAGFLV